MRRGAAVPRLGAARGIMAAAGGVFEVGDLQPAGPVEDHQGVDGAGGQRDRRCRSPVPAPALTDTFSVPGETAR